MKIETNSKGLTLIFESGYTGHRSEYIRHLMKFINAHEELHGRYVFLLNEKMGSLLGKLGTSPNYVIHFSDFDKKHVNSITRSFWEWKIISAAIRKQQNISEIMFMDIDPYLTLLVSRRFKKLNLSVKGILFQPYIHFKEIKGGVYFLIKKVIKNYLFQKYAVLLNSKIHKVFILNDGNGVGVMNKQIKNVFHTLPDPIENHVNNIGSSAGTNIKEKYAIKPENKNLLVFGSIDDRKNIINIIDALRLLPAEVKKKVHLIIAGKMDQNIREKYLEYIEKYNDEVSIAYNDEFVNAEEREPLFENCDLVLMPYINFFSASSVLGHTIVHNKNVVVSNQGIMGRIVNEHKIGITVDPANPEKIKKAITELLTESKKFEYDNRKLIDEFSPASFSKSILLN